MKCYGKIGTSQQTVVQDYIHYSPATDEILMTGERPSAEHIAQTDGTWILLEPSLEDLKVMKYAEVKEDYLKALYAVAWIDQDGSLYGYDTDPGSQLDFSLSHARAKLKGITRYNVYTDKSNLDTKEFLKHTPEMFDKVLAEVGNYQEDVYKKYYAVKELVKVAKTPEELAGISFDMEVPVDGQ